MAHPHEHLLNFSSSASTTSSSAAVPDLLTFNAVPSQKRINRTEIGKAAEHALPLPTSGPLTPKTKKSVKKYWIPGLPSTHRLCLRMHASHLRRRSAVTHEDHNTFLRAAHPQTFVGQNRCRKRPPTSRSATRTTSLGNV